MKNVLQRFREKFKVDPQSGCWQWIASLHPQGYGIFSDSKFKTVRAHKFSYVLFKGNVPEGLQLDHLCKNRGCVNPIHLEAVTSRVNNLRSDCVSGVNARKTHCKYGHELSGDNARLYVTPKRHERACRTCSRLYQRKYYHTHLKLNK